MQAAGPPPSCCSHIWKAEEGACVGDPSGQSCALQLVHLPMESTVSCPREEGSPSLVQSSAGQNRGCFLAHEVQALCWWNAVSILLTPGHQHSLLEQVLLSHTEGLSKAQNRGRGRAAHVPTCIVLLMAPALQDKVLRCWVSSQATALLDQSPTKCLGPSWATLEC